MEMQFKRTFESLSSSLSQLQSVGEVYLYYFFVVLTLFSLLRRSDRKISLV